MTAEDDAVWQAPPLLHRHDYLYRACFYSGLRHPIEDAELVWMDPHSSEGVLSGTDHVVLLAARFNHPVL